MATPLRYEYLTLLSTFDNHMSIFVGRQALRTNNDTIDSLPEGRTLHRTMAPSKTGHVRLNEATKVLVSRGLVQALHSLWATGQVNLVGSTTRM